MKPDLCMLGALPPDLSPAGLRPAPYDVYHQDATTSLRCLTFLPIRQ